MNMKRITLCLLMPFFIAGSYGSLYGQNISAGFDLSNYGVSISPDKRVMVVLAAIDAARTTDGYGVSIPVINTSLSEAGKKFREQLSSDLALLNPELRSRITTFISQYKQQHPTATDAELLAPFISMAHTLSPVPDLGDPLITSDLPESVVEVLSFTPLVRDFYRRSTFSANLDSYLKDYYSVSDSILRPTARDMVSDLLIFLQTRPELTISERVKTVSETGSKKGKLQNITVKHRERKFIIVPEMLAPADTVNLVNIKDEYFVVIPPDTDLSFSDVRRGYLQFVIDPLILKHTKEISTIHEAVKQILDERRKTKPTVSPDVYLTISRSLVAAIDAKQIEAEKVRIATEQARKQIDLKKTIEEKRKISAELETLKKQFADDTALRLFENYENDAVLVFYFAEQLKGMADTGFDISASLSQMILSFDPSKEAGRPALYIEAKNRALALREAKKNTATSAIIVESPVATQLIEIQKTITAKNYTKADADLKKLLEEHPDEPRIFYNIGRVAGLAAEGIQDPEMLKAKLLESKVAYENVIRISEKQPIDRALASLTYTALARIYEFFDEDGYAIALYDKAIAIGDVNGGAFNEALAAKQRLLTSH